MPCFILGIVKRRLNFNAPVFKDVRFSEIIEKITLTSVIISVKFLQYPSSVLIIYPQVIFTASKV